MRKNYLIFLLILIVVLVSCSYDSLYRTVTLEIPVHPWENYCDMAMWYNLCWSDYHGIAELHVENSVNQVSIRIPLGETVAICAYPLGDMHPWGCVITPEDTENCFVLNQNDGLVADLLLNIEHDAVKNLNFRKLSSVLNSKFHDYRYIDTEDLIKDILNGNLKMSSIKTNSAITVPSFPTLSGIWVSENVLDPRLVFTDNMSVELELYPGIYRYLNSEKNIELRIIVDSDGTIYHYERTPLVSAVKDC